MSHNIVQMNKKNSSNEQKKYFQMNQIDSSKEQLFFSSVELNIFVYSNSMFTFREITPNFIKKKLPLLMNYI